VESDTVEETDETTQGQGVKCAQGSLAAFTSRRRAGGLGWRHCARANGTLRTDLQLNLTERVITRTAIANPEL
jgi:hypothetical protein